jgi:hypothetical protein
MITPEQHIDDSHLLDKATQNYIDLSHNPEQMTHIAMGFGVFLVLFFIAFKIAQWLCTPRIYFGKRW